MPLREWHESKPGGKAAFIRQRVEDNAFHPIKGGSALLNARPARTDGKWVPAKNARSIKTFHLKGKLRRAAGQARLRRSTEFLLRLKKVNA
jgi:hypothetical protein